jgi:hypothetical protein
MKQIRAIKYINMFVPADSDVDHLIDITVEPYYKKVPNVTENIFNICEIIFKKSLDYGFSVDKAKEFSQKAGFEHLKNNSNADKIINDIINQLVEEYKTESNRSNLNNIPSTNNKEFEIVIENDQHIIINDYCNTGIEILKHLVGIESKMIIYELNIVKKLISISFLDLKDTQFKITDFNLSYDNVKFITDNLKIKNEIITVKEISENIQVFFLGKMIYDTKEGKRGKDNVMINLSTTEEDESEELITPYEEIVNKEYDDDEETIESNHSSEKEENIIEQDEVLTEYNNRILINPILLRKHNNINTNNLKNISTIYENKKDKKNTKLIINPFLLK